MTINLQETTQSTTSGLTIKEKNTELCVICQHFDVYLQ